MNFFFEKRDFFLEITDQPFPCLTTISKLRFVVSKPPPEV